MEYRSRYLEFLNTFRVLHKATRIYCVSLTHTSNEVSVKTGIPADDFRAVVKHVVRELRNKGDQNIHFIGGETITSDIHLKDAVHFSEDGAALFASELSKLLAPPASHYDHKRKEDESQLTLIPNPNKGRFYIHSRRKIEKIRIISSVGKPVETAYWPGSVIDIPYPVPGNYFLSVKFSNERQLRTVPFCINLP